MKGKVKKELRLIIEMRTASPEMVGRKTVDIKANGGVLTFVSSAICCALKGLRIAKLKIYIF